MHGDGAAPTEAFTVVPSVKTLGGPKTDSTQIDTTTLDTLGGYETFVMGLLKPGTLDFEVVWDPADVTQSAVRADFASRTLRNWQIVWPDVGSTTFSFAAYVKSWETAAAPNTDMTMKMVLQLSGPITESTGP
jgi:predicted secreted protein